MYFRILIFIIVSFLQLIKIFQLSIFIWISPIKSLYQYLYSIISRILLYISSILLSLFVSYIIPTQQNIFYSYWKINYVYICFSHLYYTYNILSYTFRNKSLLTNLIIIISPLLVTYILSCKFFEKTYNMVLNPICKLIK